MMRACGLASLLMGLACAPAANAELKTLTASDIDTVQQFTQLLIKGDPAAFPSWLSERHIASDRLEDDITVVYLVLAQLKLEDALAHVGHDTPGPTSASTPIGKQVILKSSTSNSALRSALTATRADVDRHLKRYLSDDAVISAQRQVAAHREALEPLYELLQGESVSSVSP